MKRETFSALFLLLTAIVLQVSGQQCPNRCSNRGSCVTGTCYCDRGFGGLDCSLAARVFNDGDTIQNERVVPGSWNYYYTIIRHPAQVLIWDVKTVAGGDVDIFVQKQTFPTLTSYLARNITSNPDFDVRINSPVLNEVYYVGIYGFSGSPYSVYTISVKTTTGCAAPCVHGVCASQQCICNRGYAGVSCDKKITTLTKDISTHSTVKTDEMAYFELNIDVGNTIDIMVNQTSIGDVDMFIKFNAIPTTTSFDYADVSLNNNFAVSIQLNERRGRWFVAIYGVAGCNFMISYRAYETCPSRCSGHGDCDVRGCACQIGFDGDYCQRMINPLRDGQTVGGFVAASSWNYYRHIPQSTADMLVTVSRISNYPGSDCDTYIRRGANPTLVNFDYRNISNLPEETIRVPDAQFATWYIGVFGFKDCEYRVKAVSTSTCPSCGTHGTCDTSAGRCICDAGWTGEYCELKITPLINDQVVNGSLEEGKWDYYSIEGVKGTYLAFRLLEVKSEGAFWLFAMPKQPPTLAVHDPALADKETNTDHHSVTTTPTETTTYYVGVYGSPFSLRNSTTAEPYQLQAWNSPFKR